jgi:hypothetical protein
MTDGSPATDTAPVPKAILPANVDDPRFAGTRDAGSGAPWTPGDAVIAEVTEPLDATATVFGSRLGLMWLAESALDTLFAVLGSALGRLLAR